MKGISCGQSVGAGNSPVSVSAHLEGLKGGTTYHYRVFAQNSAGVMGAEDGTFKTAQTP